MIRPLVFLEALFTQALNQLKTYKKGTPSHVALTWYTWMSHGATHARVGPNRAAFYDGVVEYAAKVRHCFLLSCPY